MKVTIFQCRLTHYRQGLFDLMRDKCSARGIDLLLVHGQPSQHDRDKCDSGYLPWATQVENRYFPYSRRRDLCWQPCPQAARASDLVVLTQENRLLANYFWQLRRCSGLGPRLAFWGHGRDFQSGAPGGWRERWKALWLKQVDWWFAYTALSAEWVRASGFPAERITRLDNAIDNRTFAHELAAVSPETLAALRAELGLSPRHFVGLYCGSLYPDKRLPLLFAAAERVYRHYPDFRLLVLGSGVERSWVEAACQEHAWAHYLGVQFGARKAALFRLAELMLCPGLVGLTILDAFVAGLPLLTLRDSLHSPEIAYLEPGVNGELIIGAAPAYADRVLELIRDQGARRRLSAGARAAAVSYTLENMAQQFVDGLEACLRQPVAPTQGERCS